MQPDTQASSRTTGEREPVGDPVTHGLPQPETQSPRPGHQKLVFTDPVALRYLEEDPSTVVLHRRLTLQGYEIYVVEQWACSRIHPTFVITTYTGDSSHTVFVGVLSVPTDEATWSPRLKLYFNAVAQYHARKKETPLGVLMVTDLGNFPNALTVIHVPGGDIKKHRDDFIVNEDLKRLGCSGRAALKLQYPSAATEAKFHQLYHTSERVPLYAAVIELVKQCQTALVMFDKLAPEYVDGLLCDVTEAAIGEWWSDIGTDLYDIEPGDGIMGPTTVAALLGTLIGARNRLHAFGAPVGKDAFDIANLKRGIGSFQKSVKLPRTRRLDRRTLDKLHRVTAKAATSERWTGAVKSTVAELGGKGGEMVIGMVGGRDKAGIADIETLDMDAFAHLVSGERAKWLWLGKPRKSGANEAFNNPTAAGDILFVSDNQGGYVWTSRRRNSKEDMLADRSTQKADRSGRHFDESGPADESEQHLSRTVRKGVSGKVSDARAGLERLKDAVGLPGLRSHHTRHLRDDPNLFADALQTPAEENEAEPVMYGYPDNSPRKLRNAANGAEALSREMTDDEAPDSSLEPLPDETRPPEIVIETVSRANDGEGRQDPAERLYRLDSGQSDEYDSDLQLVKSQSTVASGDRDQLCELATLALRRPQSYEDLDVLRDSSGQDNFWPRHLSFSAVEDVILGWEPLATERSNRKNAIYTSLNEAVAEEDLLVSDSRILSAKLNELNRNTVFWVTRQVDAVDGLNQTLHDRNENLNEVYLERLEEYRKLRERSSDVLAEETTVLNDSVKRVDVLGAKLDYELNLLESKVEEVEAGLGDFERHILGIESRIQSLVSMEEHKGGSWTSWLGRFLA